MEEITKQEYEMLLNMINGSSFKGDIAEKVALLKTKIICKLKEGEKDGK